MDFCIGRGSRGLLFRLLFGCLARAFIRRLFIFRFLFADTRARFCGGGLGRLPRFVRSLAALFAFGVFLRRCGRLLGARRRIVVIAEHEHVARAAHGGDRGADDACEGRIGLLVDAYDLGDGQPLGVDAVEAARDEFVAGDDIGADRHETQFERVARRRAGAKMGWYIHASVYLLVNLLLVALSVGSGRHWAVFPAQGWGIGLAIHGVVVFFLAGGSNLHERMVQAERDRLAAAQTTR